MTKRTVQIEVTSPVQDPATGEVIYQPGTRFDEGAKELEGLPAHMLRAVLTEEPDKDEVKAAKQAEKDEKAAEKADDKAAASSAASKPTTSTAPGRNV